MLKLVAHLVIAAALWFGLGLLDLHWGIRLTSVVAGAFAVHFVWEKFFFNPFLYLGAMPVAPDDPLMAEARQKAKGSFNDLRRLFPAHDKDTVVRFALKMKSGKTEYVWGDLLELGDDKAKVYLRTPPTEQVEIDSLTMEIPTADIDDWQIEMRDGSLRGGFTNRALFKIFERREGYVHAAFHEQIARFKDICE